MVKIRNIKKPCIFYHGKKCSLAKSIQCKHDEKAKTECDYFDAGLASLTKAEFYELAKAVAGGAKERLKNDK
jgi:hypothetical protein